MATNNLFFKRLGETLDYMWDWSEWLPLAETIVSATVTASDSGITVDSIETGLTSVTIWISGGDYGKHTFTCTILTNQDRIAARSIIINVVQ